MAKPNPFENRIIGYGTKPADQFQANPHNYRTHPQKQRDAVQASLRELGWIGVVVENVTTGQLIDGHERVWQALKQNEEVPYIQVELSEEQEKLALAIFDPITYMAETDTAILDALLRDVNTGEAALQELLAGLAEDNGLYGGAPSEVHDPGPQIDRAEELRAKWGVSSGDLWQMGEHRLICGDCTDADVVARVMGGEKAQMVSADPPFGLGLFEGKGSIGLSKEYGPVVGDKDASTAVRMYQAVAPLADRQVWWGANHWGGTLLGNSSCWLVWDKDHHGMTFADAELAWTNINSPVRCFRHAWSGADRDSEKGEDRLHVNQKPVALFAWYIAAFTAAGEIVLDPCCGVAGSLLACEQLNRRCRAVEISPAYVAVALERWATATQREPVRVG